MHDMHCMYACMYICTYACMYVDAYVRTYTCTYIKTNSYLKPGTDCIILCNDIFNDSNYMCEGGITGNSKHILTLIGSYVHGSYHVL